MASSPGPRILVVARELTPTPRDGGGLRRRHLVEALCTVGPTAAFGFVAGPAPCAGVEAWRTASDPDAARTPEGADVAAALRAGRSPLAVVESPATAGELADFAREFEPDVVVISGGELFDYVDVVRPLVLTLAFDLDYAQAVGLGAMAAADPNRRRALVWRHLLNRVADDERAALRRVDQVWLSSDDERERLRATLDDESVTLVVAPNVVDVGSYARAPRDDPGAFVYPARFDYWPNEEAARVLVHHVLPELPGASLTLVGMAPPPWLRELDDERVHVTGAVPDIRPYLTGASVMPIPLTAGSGTRLKVLEAFATGLPVVSTAKGVEGLALVDGVHYVGAESPGEFVAALERLRVDEAFVEATLTASTEWVHAHGSITTLAEVLRTALAAGSG